MRNTCTMTLLAFFDPELGVLSDMWLCLAIVDSAKAAVLALEAWHSG